MLLEQSGDGQKPLPGGEPPLEDFVVRDLSEAAQKALENSYSPYSGFAVGAAVLSGEGRIYPGTNLENASFGLTLCAERAAVAAAVSAGERTIRAVAVYTSTDEPTVPCGACLATVAEFRDPDFREGDVPILLLGRFKERWTSLAAHLPEIFKINPKERK
jgi:cytidine deaminase